MSAKAMWWALERVRCPSSAAKLVLIALANFVNDRDESWCSVATIARLSELDRKTVPSAIEALERAGLIEKTGRFDGRTRSVPVYRLLIEADPKTGGLAAEAGEQASGEAQEPSQAQAREATPDTGELSKPAFPAKRARKRGNDPLSDPHSPKDAIASLPPNGGRGSAARATRTWSIPILDSLPPQAKAIAEQWPAGAYEAEGEAFLNDPVAIRRRGRAGTNPDAAWASHVVRIGAKPLRDAKAGVRFGPTAQPEPAKPGPPRVNTHDEGVMSAEIRAHLRHCLGARTYDHWVSPVMIDVDGRVVTVFVASDFLLTWLQQHYADAFVGAARATLGSTTIRWRRASPEQLAA